MKEISLITEQITSLTRFICGYTSMISKSTVFCFLLVPYTVFPPLSARSKVIVFQISAQKKKSLKKSPGPQRSLKLMSTHSGKYSIHVSDHILPSM